MIERELKDDDPLAGFGAWNETTIDESVRDLIRELDDDVEADHADRRYQLLR